VNHRLPGWWWLLPDVERQWLRWGGKAAHHLQGDQWPALLSTYEAEEGLVVEPDTLAHPAGELPARSGSSSVRHGT
jgi:hypothetical protein